MQIQHHPGNDGRGLIADATIRAALLNEQRSHDVRRRLANRKRHVAGCADAPIVRMHKRQMPSLPHFLSASFIVYDVVRWYNIEYLLDHYLDASVI